MGQVPTEPVEKETPTAEKFTDIDSNPDQTDPRLGTPPAEDAPIE